MSSKPLTSNQAPTEGQAAPRIDLRHRVNGDWATVNTGDLFGGRNVIVFALPGAYTPTCSSTHVPRFNELAPVFRANGIDEIICFSVNDPFVMDSWKREQKAADITFLPDGNGEFTEAMGMLVDKTDLNFGKRSWRYSMLVRDGVIEKMFVEPQQPGDPFEVSDADTMLNYINANAQLPERISLFTKPGCSHCVRAKSLLNQHGLRYEEIELGTGNLSLSSLAAVTGQETTPQIYVEGDRIGTADELELWIAARGETPLTNAS